MHCPHCKSETFERVSDKVRLGHPVVYRCKTCGGIWRSFEDVTPTAAPAKLTPAETEAPSETP